MPASEPSRGSEPSHSPQRVVRRVAIIGPDWRSLVRLRGDLIAHLRKRGHRVLCLAPLDPLADTFGAHVGRLEALGVECSSYPLESADLRFFADRKTVSALAEKLAGWRPHVAVGYQPKPMLLGALAARKARVPRIVTIVSNLGLELAGPEEPAWRWQWLARAAFRASHAIVFHNHADRRRLDALGLLPERANTRVVPGAGVDLDHHAAQPLPPATHGLTFLMLSPLQLEKGVLAFCAAARQVRAWHSETRFVLAGPDGAGSGALRPVDLEAFTGLVEVRGDHDDVRPLFAEAHVVVLPSVREGMSRTLIEALANARPIITSNIPGCRETVDESINGIIVPPQDAGSLAEAMQHLIRRRELLPAMAHASRLKAERLFDVRHVNAGLMSVMGLE